MDNQKDPNQAQFNGVTPRVTERWMQSLIDLRKLVVDPPRWHLVLPDPMRRSTGFNAAGTSYPILAAWGHANLAQFTPFEITELRITVHSLNFVVGGTGGTFDTGIYDEDGVRLTQSVAAVRTLNTPYRDVFDLELPQGRYYAAGVSSGTVIITSKDAAFGGFQALGFRTMANAYPLPAQATFDAEPTDGIFMCALEFA